MADKQKRQLTEQDILAIRARRELERRKMMRDKVYFFENYVYIENKDGKTPDERSCLFKLFPEQKRALEEIQNNRLNIVIKARQLGMTWLTLSDGLHEALKTQQFTMAILSQTEDYMQEAINRVEYIITRLPKWLIQPYNKETKEWNSMYLYEKFSDEVTIYHPTDENGIRIVSSIKGFISTEKAGRSITADYMLFDEWAYHEGAEAVFQAAFPTINRPDSGKFVGLSSNKRGSFFESIVRDCIDEKKMGFNLIFLNVFADPRRTLKWYEATKAVLTNTWQAEYPETIEQALSAGNLTAFPEFSRSIHVCEPFKIPDHWTKWASCDNGLGGIRDPYAWYKGAISEDGTVYIYYEYTTEKGKGDITYYSDQAKKFMRDSTIDITEQVKQEIDDFHLGYETDGIQQFSKENLQYVVFGVDAFNKDTSKGTGKSLLDFYSQGGLSYPTVKATTDRKLRKSAMHEYLKPFEDGMTGNKTAKLQIFSTCRYLIKYIPDLTVDENNPDVVGDNSKIDNVYDSATYLLLGSPKNNSQKIEQPESKVEKWKKEKINKMKKSKRRKGVLN